MINKLKQHKLILIIFIIGIILIVTGTTYSFYKIKLEGQKQHIVSSDVISFTYKESEDKISITNMNPISDTKGKKNNYFEFKVSSKLKENMNIKYIVSLSKIDIENSFEDNDIKMYLTDGNDNELISPTIISLLEENKKIKDSKIIYANTFAYNEQEQTHTYRIRIWLKENVDMSKYTKVVETETGTNVSLEQKTYKFKINVNTIESIDTSGANTPVLASNMIPVYYFGSTVKKADENNTYTPVTYYLGDSNFDGWINSTDFTNIIHPKNYNKPAKTLQQKTLDMNGDGVIDQLDLDILRSSKYYDKRVTEVNEKRTTLVNDYRWYSYESSGENKGMWANAVTVTSDKLETYKNASVGTTISMDDITTMWVWIPRFNAVIPSNYNGGTADNPGSIDVTFVKQNETAIDAFTFGNKELSGFWYGKFEVGHTTLASSTTNNNLGCTNETCSNANNIIIKPNVTSLRNNNVSNFFYASRSMEQPNNSFGFVSSEVDTHMSKNNEWGAVAYLTQSIYGRCTSSTTCTEVGINNNSNYITGYGAPAGSEISVTNGKYNTDLGKDASTTGNIYGIYDMSGGSFEFVMGVYNKIIYQSGFSSLPNEKYYNNYTEISYTGHALTETNGWYGDYNVFVNKNLPWLKRGSNNNNGMYAGIFSFSYDYGGVSTSDLSSRFVITNE